MLTVIRELAEEAESRAARPSRRRAPAGARRARRGGGCPHARAARRPARGRRRRRRRRGPGGARSRHRRALAGEPLAGAAARRARRSTRSTRSSRASATAPSSSSRARARRATRSKRELEQLGDSLLVVGDPTRSRCTSTPTTRAPRSSLGTALGTIEGVEIADMHQPDGAARGAAPPRRSPAARESGVVAVVAGEGNRAAVREPRRGTGRRGRADDEPVHGRARRGGGAPSAPTRSSLLPNNTNVVLAADQAAQVAGKPVARRANRVDSRRGSPRSSPSTQSVRPRRTPRR